MLIPLYESYGTIVSYPIEDTLETNSTAELENAATLDLNATYGETSTGFAAGLVCQLYNQSGSTVLILTDGTCPIGFFADSFVDTLKSGKGSFYLACDNNIFKTKSNYDIGQTFAVNTICTAIPSGTNRGFLTPTASYATQPTVAIVMEPPTSAAANDFMVIMTDLQT